MAQPPRPPDRTDPAARYRERLLETYGAALGRSVDELITPALLLDLPAAQRNITKMASALRSRPARIRPHVKVHKSVELSLLQIEAGAIGLSTATVWEAAALAAAGIDGLFVANTVGQPEKLRVLAELARDRKVSVAVDDAINAAALSAAATAAGSELGVLIEIDTGMGRAGVDGARQAAALAASVSALGHLRLEGVTGYEGHCSLESDPARRADKQASAMDLFLDVAHHLEGLGFPCPIRSAGGTATWDLTASRPGITEIQAGSYVVMDNFHGKMIDEFEHALTIATTVISRAGGRLIVDAGSKSAGLAGGPTLVSPELPVVRFDEEHGIFKANATIDAPIGTALRLVPGYAAATVNLHDFYHVVVDGAVVDLWPIFPRGPAHHGLALG